MVECPKSKGSILNFIALCEWLFCVCVCVCVLNFAWETYLAAKILGLDERHER